MDKIILVSHCFFNPHSVIKPKKSNTNLSSDIISYFLSLGYGFFQLPCPELTCMGKKRWAMSFEQYDTPFFKSHSQKILDPLIPQLEDYLNNDTIIAGVIGIKGSPSCATHIVSSNPDWEGIFQENIESCIKIEGDGVFIKELKIILKQLKINCPMFELPSTSISNEEKSKWIQDIKKYMI
ncbi:MAG: hypothetical protein COB02_09835 [Candidatus Cloacimonadota bacterium]|nr:MAG: hypothetical protein COB02_09835 [Candidatus Cloacimonadota bacterium]